MSTTFTGWRQLFLPVLNVCDRSLPITSSFFVFSFLSTEDRLWECGNLASCARFPSRCGNRFWVSIGTAFP
jgi:hypothetical protein